MAAMSLDRRIWCLGLLLAIALTACRQEQEEDSPTAAAPAPEAADHPLPEPDVDVDVDMDAGADVDPAAPPVHPVIEGTFTGTLPCADCPGVDTVLSLHPDGSYELVTRRSGDAGTEAERHSGAWFASEDGRAILIAGDDLGGGDGHHIFEWQGENRLRLLPDAPSADDPQSADADPDAPDATLVRED